MKQIKQWDARDCGVSCVSYLIQYYGGFVPMEKLREDTFTTHNGTNAYFLVQTLKKYGFDAVGKKVALEELEKCFFPAIGHFRLKNGLEHFMIIQKVHKKEILLMDPAVGKRKMSLETFKEQWDGIVLEAIPQGMILKMPKEKSVVSFLKEILFLHKRKVCFLIFLSFLLSMLPIIESFYLKVSLHQYQNIAWDKTFWYIVFFFGSLLVLRSVFFYLKEMCRLYLSKDIEIDYMYSFLAHIFKIPLLKFKSYQTGEVLTRIAEAREIKEIFADVFVSIALNSFLGFSSFFILYFLSKELLLVLSIGVGIYFLVGFIFSKALYRIILMHMEQESIWQEHLLEGIRLFEPVKHLHASSKHIRSLEEGLAHHIREKLGYQVKIERIEIFKNFGLEVLGFILLTYGMYLYFQGSLSGLDFLTFQSLYMYLLTPLKEFMDILPKFYYLKGVLRKISEYMALVEENIDEPTIKMLDTSITFKDVTFSYTPIAFSLEHLSIDLENHEHVFLKGPSGVGKSTICRLLIKEVEDYTGTILIGGQNLKDYNLATVRQNIVYLSQKEPLLKKSIKENIAFYSDFSLEDFQKICEICELESVVSKRALRYETIIHEENLSGGEKQRVLLARTLLKKGEIYLLDECLSEVDERLEKKIIKGVRKYLQDKTLIYISHRDHSKSFERVVNLSNG